MPATLYSTTNAFPILTGYSTRSFDSGLLLWQGTYITRDTSAPPFAEGDPIPDGDYGAIDGLFVHPAPVLKKSPGSLAEWTVTAYGRTNFEGKSRVNLILGVYAATIIGFNNSGDVVETNTGGRAFHEVAIVTKVIRENENRGELVSPVRLKSFVYPQADQELKPLLEDQGFTVSTFENMQRFDSSNFGRFFEVTYSVSTSLFAIKTV